MSDQHARKATVRLALGQADLASWGNGRHFTRLYPAFG
jgi:hypothetical protein